MRIRQLLIVVVLLGLAEIARSGERKPAAEADWTPLGSVKSVHPGQPNRYSVLTVCQGGRVRLSFPKSNIVRVHMAPADEEFAPDDLHLEENGPYFIVRYDWSPGPNVSATDEGDRWNIVTDALKVVVEKNPFRFLVYDETGRLLTSQAAGGLAYLVKSGRPERIREVMLAQAGERFCGFGGKELPLDVRGLKVSMRPTELGESPGRKNQHGGFPIPWFLSSRGYGLLFNHLAPDDFDMGASSQDRYSFGGTYAPKEGLGLDYYIIYGPEFDPIMEGYVDLAGRPYLGPKFLYEFYRVKWPTFGLEGTVDWAKRMREGGYPGSYVVDPAWSAEKYSVSEGRRTTIAALAKLGFKVATCEYLGWTTKALNEAGIRPMAGGMADLTHPEAIAGYWDLQQEVFKAGIGGWGFDAIERAGGTLQNGYPGRILALLAAKTLVEKSRAAGRHTPVLLRGGGPGSHRYAWGWPGDLPNGLEILKSDLDFIRGMGLVGFNSGSNMGGYKGTNPPDVYLRRVAQMALVFPIPRMHGDRDPWKQNAKTADAFRYHFQLRQRLMPYLYSGVISAHRTGRPLVAPLVFEHREDERAWSRDFHFMLGDRLLVAPVTEAAETWPVYLPPGGWYHFWSAQRHDGGRVVEVPAPLYGRDGLPLFVKEGSILPMMPRMAYVGEKPADPLTLVVFPRNGRFAAEILDCASPTSPILSTHFLGRQEADGTINLELPAATSAYEIILPTASRPPKVIVDGVEINEIAKPETLPSAVSGWLHGAGSYPGGATVPCLVVRIPPAPGQARAITIPAVSAP